jgi:hypothetical protein
MCQQELEDFGVTLGHLSRIEDAIRNLTVSPQNHIPVRNSINTSSFKFKAPFALTTSI